MNVTNLKQKLFEVSVTQAEFDVLLGVAVGVVWTSTDTNSKLVPSYNRHSYIHHGRTPTTRIADMMGGLMLPERFPTNVVIDADTLYNVECWNRRQEQDSAQDKNYAEAGAHLKRVNELFKMRTNPAA